MTLFARLACTLKATYWQGTLLNVNIVQHIYFQHVIISRNVYQSKYVKQQPKTRDLWANILSWILYNITGSTASQILIIFIIKHCIYSKRVEWQKTNNNFVNSEFYG